MYNVFNHIRSCISKFTQCSRKNILIISENNYEFIHNCLSIFDPNHYRSSFNMELGSQHSLGAFNLKLLDNNSRNEVGTLDCIARWQ